MAAASAAPHEIRQRFVRGGHWWTLAVNQYVGSFIAAGAIRRAVTPNQLSLLNAVAGIVTSALVLTLYSSSPLLAALVGMVGWQLAYSTDCADGQVARATGRTSLAGARLDLLCDFVVHTSVLASVAHIAATEVGGAYITSLLTVLAIGHLVPLFYQALLTGTSGPAQDISRRRWSLLSIAGGASDWGFHVFLFCLVMPLGGWSMVAVVGMTAALHYTFLARETLKLLSPSGDAS
jgi:phosphatidylglycerophosphate synthase